MECLETLNELYFSSSCSFLGDCNRILNYLVLIQNKRSSHFFSLQGYFRGFLTFEEMVLLVCTQKVRILVVLSLEQPENDLQSKEILFSNLLDVNRHF